MQARFATGLDRPLLADGYPLTLTVAISPAVRQQIYFERVYRSATGEELAIRATLIQARGLVLLQEAGPVPAGTASVIASVTNQNCATEPDPVRVDLPEADEAVRFATTMERPRIIGDLPQQLAVAIGATRQPLYLERVYLDDRRREIAIRSDLVHARNMLVGFNIHQPEPPLGTKYMEVSITNQYRATELAGTLEYESQEYNELEYN